MSTHGGKRPGAGRPKGGIAKKSAEAIKKAEAEGIMPLDFMLSIMRGINPDTNQPEEYDWSFRGDMAKAAFPALHPKLASVEHTGDGGGMFNIIIPPRPDPDGS